MMNRFSLFGMLIVITLGTVYAGLAQDDDKMAVEGTVRSYEQALQEYDFDKANSLLMPDAKWIEDSYPEPAAIRADNSGDWWQQAKAAKLRVTNHPHDFSTHIQGEVAWVIVLIDVEHVVDNDAARAFTLRDHPSEREWTSHFVESEVLVKTASGWKVALGHTSSLPKSKA
jgi:ketosteroid isomerase-like protein